MIGGGGGGCGCGGGSAPAPLCDHGLLRQRVSVRTTTTPTTTKQVVLSMVLVQ